jgi:hypothetical protein
MINGIIPSFCFCGTGPYTRSANPVWSFVDLTGKQFDDTFYMWVLSNQIPYIPAAVYQTPTGTPWTDPIQFLANGTLPNNIYWDPNVIYRLEFRHNLGLLPPSQNDPLIYLVEDYAPFGNNSEVDTVTGLPTDNQISNPQFAEVSFTNPLTLTNVTNPGPIEIAPDWFLTLTGTGNLVVNQVPLNNAPTTINPTNAPYALEIHTTGGWTSSILSQRFQQNGMLWANKYVSLSFTALIQGAPQQVTGRLYGSNGAPLAILLTTLLSNSFGEYTGVALLPPPLNPDVPPNAYIDFQMILPPVADIYLTSFQLIASTVETTYEYEQDTVNRQIDHLFHYYNPQLQFKPISSYLVGWDFPLNPAQINGDTYTAQNTGVNTSYYAWDQTILFQSVTSAITVSRGTQGGLQLTAALAGQMAAIQYLDQVQAREILNNRLSVNINCLGTIAAGNVIGSVSLWYTKDANLPNVATGTNQTFIATLDPITGKPATFTGGFNWIEVKRDIQQNATFNLPSATSSTFGFNEWSIDNGVSADANLATFFAIVIGFAPLAAADTIELTSVSLVPGDIPTIPAPKTQDEVRKDCERYYEMSYQNFAAVGTATVVNALFAPQDSTIPSGGNFFISPNSFTVQFDSLKRTINSVMSIYSANTGTISAVGATARGSATSTLDIAIATWTPTTGDKYCNFAVVAVPLSGHPFGALNATTPGQNYIGYHFIADARLGIVN